MAPGAKERRLARLQQASTVGARGDPVSRSRGIDCAPNPTRSPRPFGLGGELREGEFLCLGGLDAELLAELPESLD